MPERLQEILRLLRSGDESLYREADEVRRKVVGDEIHLRGLIEISGNCVRNCRYCGLRRGNAKINRYRMPFEEIIGAAEQAEECGCGTVVLQSGEDPWFTKERMCSLISAIKEKTGLAVTLSIGERPHAEYRAFRESGCDRYLLRFETSNRDLFREMHPDGDFDRRTGCLEAIRSAGIQVGSGFMIGLPAGIETIAGDILFATSLELDMIGAGPFIPNPSTPMGGERVQEDYDVYFRTMAILRILNPHAHIPATTAFDVLYPGARERVLDAGANVFMPNLTPAKYKREYALYPKKASVDCEASKAIREFTERMAKSGRGIAEGPGHACRLQAEGIHHGVRRDLCAKS